MPRGSGPLTRALVVAVLLASTTACVPFGTDANPTRTHPAPITSAPAATPTASESSQTLAPTATAYPALGPLPDGVAPVRPAALDQPPTLEGAKAVAAYFLLLFPYIYQTGDLAAWDALANPQCTFCSDTAADVRKKSGADQHVKGGNLDIRDLNGTEIDVGRFFEVKGVIHETKSQTVDSVGSVVDDLPAGANSVDVVVLFENGSWSVRGVDHKALEE